MHNMYNLKHSILVLALATALLTAISTTLNPTSVKAHVVSCIHNWVSNGYHGNYVVGRSRASCPRDLSAWDSRHIRRHRINHIWEFRRPGTTRVVMIDKRDGSWSRAPKLDRRTTLTCSGMTGRYEVRLRSVHLVNYRVHVGSVPLHYSTSTNIRNSSWGTIRC
jgi:hypothetical protein